MVLFSALSTLSYTVIRLSNPGFRMYHLRFGDKLLTHTSGYGSRLLARGEDVLKWGSGFSRNRFHVSLVHVEAF